MKNKQRHYGFSLIEVLFAMLILTMGIIFVAGQFPLGLANARKITEETRSEVDAHNAAIMVDLQLAALDPATFIGDDATFFINRDGNVNYLPRPNAMLAGAGRPDIEGLVMDDPLGQYYPLPASGNYFENQSGQPPHPVSYYPTEASVGMSLQNSLLPLNIGKIVSPPVDQTDQDVQARLNHIESSFANINRAVFDVATNQRNFNTAQFYQHIGNNRFRFFIFTLRGSNKRLVYPAQKTELSYANRFLDPRTLSSNQARYYPIPWYIEFELSATQGEGRFNLTDGVFNSDPAIARNIFSILRVGSYIIDADNTGNIGDSGYVYEIAELEANEADDEYWVTLRTDLWDLMTGFWIFPPGVDPDSDFWDGSQALDFVPWTNAQPVVKVTQKIVAFNVKTVYSHEFHE